MITQRWYKEQLHKDALDHTLLFPGTKILHVSFIIYYLITEFSIHHHIINHPATLTGELYTTWLLFLDPDTHQMMLL